MMSVCFSVRAAHSRRSACCGSAPNCVRDAACLLACLLVVNQQHHTRRGCHSSPARVMRHCFGASALTGHLTTSHCTAAAPSSRAKSSVQQNGRSLAVINHHHRNTRALTVSSSSSPSILQQYQAVLTGCAVLLVAASSMCLCSCAHDRARDTFAETQHLYVRVSLCASIRAAVVSPACDNQLSHAPQTPFFFHAGFMSRTLPWRVRSPRRCIE